MLGAIILAAMLSVPLGGPPQLPMPPLAPAAAPAPAATPDVPVPAELVVGGGPRFTFEVRDIQVEGLDWRGMLKGRARRLGWQAGVMTWAIPESAARDLLDHVQKSPRSNVVQAPRAIAEAGQSARTLTGSTVHFVVDMERRADGPPGQEQALAYEPVLEQMHNGLDLAVSATPSPEGIVLGLNLDERNIQQVHTGAFEDAIDGPASPDDRPILGIFRRRGEGEDPAVSKAGAMKLQASFQVPEVIRSHVEGSWPMKPGESLLISLGARSGSEKWGRPVVTERLVLITARPESAGSLSAPGPAAMPAPPPGSLPAAAPPPPFVPGAAQPPGFPRDRETIRE